VPGQAIKIPDPNDPTGKTMIEIPAEAMEVIAKVPEEKVKQPVIGADLDTPSATAIPGAVPAKKMKKKKKKKLPPPTDTMANIEEQLNRFSQELHEEDIKKDGSKSELTEYMTKNKSQMSLAESDVSPFQ